MLCTLALSVHAHAHRPNIIQRDLIVVVVIVVVVVVVFVDELWSFRQFKILSTDIRTDIRTDIWTYGYTALFIEVLRN